jgi:putative phosphoesterase
MIVGIMSDSHGKRKAVRRALKLFDGENVGLIVHCGDVGDRAVFDELVGRDVRFVWGNTDDPDGGLIAYLQSVGIPLPQEIPLRFEVDGKRFAVYHGHERGFEQAVRSLEVDYLLHGHTHEWRNERLGSRRIINPGALQRANPKTVAVLNPATDEVHFHEIVKE